MIIHEIKNDVFNVRFTLKYPIFEDLSKHSLSQPGTAKSLIKFSRKFNAVSNNKRKE